MTYSERRGRKRSATRELLIYLLVGLALIMVGLAIWAGALHLGRLPSYDGLAIFIFGGGIDAAGLLRYRVKIRNAGLRRS